ncbi:hypothetical protein A3J43_01985 [Candidatus Uhrbacteria bacterium RIFCSPHIGHO2_12_FULL_54_23]|uniref:Uncharacterized protein n=3 Tax=Candidatus Uhriibacteriota TaxID=1752732 RepID=A0A1F7UIF8_9BACT|nr:MAG: hypothetical protein A3J43_01985 [Candidatus Uhrbacteria bacterium RIFCSPHIGHO2_12_FULL_54_23]OGL83721.1 MAG: hypothetical protein A3B36_01840 [Candidatus Uhrbacteria bacterium RIFCSPLOWO2_01_FULL_55_36]OGL90382.1 MAG: hypothetical protein A3J36_00020 [Candidatus Uhrbacteria bacterium RIFCSPLOWO2_02_FULL_54_37]
MEDQQHADYQNLLTELIKKQIVILGPDIAVLKARNVSGMKVADDGTVMEMNENPQELLNQLVEQYVQLSGLIVKKAMEPLLSKYPSITLPHA